MHPRPANSLRESGSNLVQAWNRYWFTPSSPAMLGLLRILAGTIALYLHATLGPDLVTFFGPDGILPSETVREALGGTDTLWAPSYLHFTTSPAVLLTLHWAGAFVLLLFTLGLFTRVTSVLSLVVFLSTVHRAMLLTNETEWVLAFVLLYLCIGPSGKRFSLQAWLAKRKQLAPNPSEAIEEPEPSFFTATIATRLLQWHTRLVYASMGLAMLVTPNRVWWEGDAIWFLLGRTKASWINMGWLAGQPLFVNLWTYGTVIYLIAFALLIQRDWAKRTLLLLGVPFWLLLAAVSGLTPFCLLMLGLNVVFLSRKC